MMSLKIHVSSPRTWAFVRCERAQTGIEPVCVHACLLGDARALTASVLLVYGNVRITLSMVTACI
jgi:hypothetical protein